MQYHDQGKPLTVPGTGDVEPVVARARSVGVGRRRKRRPIWQRNGDRAGCWSAVNFSFFLCLAAFRTRSSAWDTLSRICARRVRCWPVFPLVPALGSTTSAAGFPALFGGFFATMTESDFSSPCVTGFGYSPRPGFARSDHGGNSWLYLIFSFQMA